MALSTHCIQILIVSTFFYVTSVILQQEQKEKVDEIECNVEETAWNIKEGTSFLARAARYRATVYPIAGAVLGGCLGGPIGLIAGMKLGGLAALGCGFIGKHP
jgi:syntaxin 17